MIDHLAILGLGLIGGSLARALRASGGVGRISAFDPDPRQGEAGLKLGVVDRVCPTAAAAVADASLVVIAVPVLHTAEALADCRAGLRPGTVVTDVGSTKGSVLADIRRLLGELPDWFVPGHPIAGTEKSGVAHAFPELFRGRRVILTPHDRQAPGACEQGVAMWQSVGARVVQMDAARHDAIFAATSHFPHLLAYSFVDMLARRDDADDLFPNAGGGFRDFTRIASSSPAMWHDIIRANAGPVRDLLQQQIAELQHLLQLLQADDWAGLQVVFERARRARERHLSEIE